MGYAPNKVKRRRHSNHLRLYASLVLLGVQFEHWGIHDMGTWIVVNVGGQRATVQMFTTLPSAVHWAAKILEIE